MKLSHCIFSVLVAINSNFALATAASSARQSVSPIVLPPNVEYRINYADILHRNYDFQISPMADGKNYQVLISWPALPEGFSMRVDWGNGESQKIRKAQMDFSFTVPIGESTGFIFRVLDERGVLFAEVPSLNISYQPASIALGKLVPLDKQYLLLPGQGDRLLSLVREVYVGVDFKKLDEQSLIGKIDTIALGFASRSTIARDTSADMAYELLAMWVMRVPQKDWHQNPKIDAFFKQLADLDNPWVKFYLNHRDYQSDIKLYLSELEQ